MLQEWKKKTARAHQGCEDAGDPESLCLVTPMATVNLRSVPVSLRTCHLETTAVKIPEVKRKDGWLLNVFSQRSLGATDCHKVTECAAHVPGRKGNDTEAAGRGMCSTQVKPLQVHSTQAG